MSTHHTLTHSIRNVACSVGSKLLKLVICNVLHAFSFRIVVAVNSNVCVIVAWLSFAIFSWHIFGTLNDLLFCIINFSSLLYRLYIRCMMIVTKMLVHYVNALYGQVPIYFGSFNVSPITGGTLVSYTLILLCIQDDNWLIVFTVCVVFDFKWW